MQSNYLNVFAMRLRLARKAKNLSQERLGILAGIDESSASARMNQYEKGKHTPDFLMASQIAKVLDIPTAYFYIEDDLLAEIIKQSYLLSSEQKAQVLDYMKTLEESSLRPL
ncbi:transcriptional regulator with XRE-family HTH domain [Acinetobacter baylyi]|uniref:Transcriptional regulator with XRE-family HTH domain n=1 Tax=Acinetobacter baylyi TaxID=202950 RepID=A0ABU0URN6_ACIBI|nr:helix-turn-helix transcriptional regulator [Acinetobacter baylyi]MDQ1207209.1 transcriptional regulator with XRE-family HTH domain [Acinetobacter baylyi]MDR6105709.1 transcriptional regulator with XRE-family HTH domain [Acinetobacter baylyi]MDR6187571.1 transcriptional regulator with XRE-family HTH domain [Acinetobacter baylyi]